MLKQDKIKVKDQISSFLKTHRKQIFIILLCGVVLFAGGEAAKTYYFSTEEAKAAKPVGPEGTNGNYILPFDQMSYTLRLGWPADGNATNDSILVIDSAGRWVRKIKPLNSWLSLYALTSSLSAYATTASLSGYVPTSRTLTINGTAYDLSANRSWTVSGTTYSAGTGLSLTGTTFANTAPDQTVTLTAGNRISITGSYPNFTISYVEPTINQVSRTVNSAYTISTKQAQVFYSIPVTATNPLLAGTSAGTATLQYSTNGGSTWNNAIATSASSTVGLSVTISLTTGGSNILGGFVPANSSVRINTSVSGTATVGNATGQEIY